MKDRKKRIAIISRESNARTLDIAMLEAELIRRGADVTVLSKLLKKEKSLKALGYAGHILKQEAAILAADVVVLDTYCIPASMIPHRKDTKVIQIWHALGALKKFGWQTVGKAGGSSERVAKMMKMHRGYDFVLSASDITADHFSEAFGVDRSKMVRGGLPRIDYVKSVTRGSRHEDTAARILTKYPQLKGEKKTVLYAPTFRPGKSVDVQSLIDALGTDKFNIAVKLHPVYRNAAPHESAGGVIYDDDFSSTDWLSVADIIISDYSSFVIESTLADKPLFIYAYDIEDYEADTGLNIDFETEPIAPYVFRDAASLAAAIGKACAEPQPGADGAAAPAGGYDYDALRAFRERYIDIDTGDPTEENHCTAALADLILSLA